MDTEPDPTSGEASDAGASPGTIAAPSPILFILTLIAGVLFNRIKSVRIAPTPWNRFVGVVLFTLGTILFVLAFKQMRDLGVSPDHEDEPPELLTDGPYRISRNPIYLGNCLQYIGLSLIANSVWAAGLIVPLLIYLNRVTKREEAYLEERFGDDFIQYRDDVGRWL